MVCIKGELASSSYKAFTLDTPLVTPTGWTTVGEAQVGDLLYDEEGFPTRIVGATDVTTYRSCHKVEFDDGVQLIAHSGNAWSVLSYARRARMPEALQDWRDVWHKTERVLGPELETRAYRGTAKTSNWTIPLHRPLETRAATLPLPPYVMGAWLGDGCKDNATMTTCDAWMIDEFRRQGMAVTPRAARKQDRSTDFGFRPEDGIVNLVSCKGGGKRSLRDAGVLQNKHIPTAYLRASRPQRLDLLRGFMDTDGFRQAAGAAAIEQRDRVLVDGLVELVRSLGWRAHYTHQQRPHPNRPGDIYRFWQMNFKPSASPYSMPRKAETWAREATWHRRFTHRTLVSVEPATRRRVRGLLVASASRRFLAGAGMIPV
jgi:replicative DNA helicase